MSAADWYPDPTQGGRLRYWDGVRWTEHVSTDGEVARSAIEGIAPAPPRPGDGVGAQPVQEETPAPVGLAGTVPSDDAPAATGVAGLFGASGPGGPTALGRAGLAIGAIGGIVAAFATGKIAAEQADPGATLTIGGGSWLGIVAAIVCVAGILSPWLWGRIAAATVGWTIGAFLAFAVVGVRTNDIFSTASGASDVTLGPAGWLMLIGSVLLLLGGILAIVQVRTPIRDVDPAAVETPREGKGISSLICGIVGFILPVAAPAAVGLGLAARDDHRASDGRAGGLGMAKAGLIVGLIALALWTIGLILAMFLSQP